MPQQSSIIAIDVGNTRAKFGLFIIDGDGRAEPVEVVARVLSETDDLAAAFHAWWKAKHRTAPPTAMIAGSNPDVRDEFIANWPLENCSPISISGAAQIPIVADVDVPSRVGIDRLLNVFAASRMLQRPQPVITIDSGTATTVDLMTTDQTFRGGTILPGLRLSAIAMHDYTARLPLLNVDEELVTLPGVPGRNTEAAMRAGLFIGQLGAVKEISARLTQAAFTNFGETVAPQLFVTGGGGRHLVDHLPNAIFVDSLALHGLAMLSVAGGQSHEFVRS
jgi:type III pantothenate kinase